MSRHTTRRSGLSLIEMIVAISLSGIVLGPLYHVARLSGRAARQARDATAADARAERLRDALAHLVHDGRVVPALSIDRDGGLHEEAVADATTTWRASDALVVRGADGYHVVERAGRALVHRRLGLDGQVVSAALVEPVTAARFDVVGVAPGLVEYEVRFADDVRPARGVVAPRVLPPSAGPPTAPRPAPRLGGGR